MPFTLHSVSTLISPKARGLLVAVVPGLSALAAVVVLGEPLHWNLVLGLVLVTMGIVFGVRKL